MRVLYGILPVGFCLWLAACGISTPLPSAAAETPLFSKPFVNASLTETPTVVPPPTRPVTPNASETVVLTLWVPEEFAAGAERGGDVLKQQILEFESAHPNIRLDYALKAPYGKGGIVDWLTQLHDLIPDRLPDAAIVDSRELVRLEKLGLLHPLQRDLPAGAFWDLFPPAQRMARLKGQWNNQPLVLETEHLVYDTRRVATPPLSWQAVLSDSLQFAFAADSTEAFLFQYMQNGGSFDPREHPSPDAGVMQAILEYYQEARANRNLNESTALLQSAREIMPLFVSGQVPMAQVRARDFLAERSRLPDAGVGAIPTRDGSATTLVSGWSFVVLTEDAGKHRAATDYLMWLIEPSRLGEWSGAAGLLPASSSAFARSVQESTYADVMWNLLQNALVAPSFDVQAPFAQAWRSAVTAVLNGRLAPDDAAFRAVQTITQ